MILGEAAPESFQTVFTHGLTHPFTHLSLANGQGPKASALGSGGEGNGGSSNRREMRRIDMILPSTPLIHPEAFDLFDSLSLV
jgi:hypothetical protein